MYTLEGIYIAGKQEFESGVNVPIENNTLQNPENYTYEDVEQSSNPIEIIFGFFDFLAFTPLDLPSPAQVILTISTTICAIAIGILIYSFIRDWIPLIK